MKDDHLISKLAKQISDGSPSQIIAALTAIRCHSSLLIHVFKAQACILAIRRVPGEFLQQNCCSQHAFEVNLLILAPGTVCRDLCVRGECRAAFGEAGVVHTLIGLLYSEDEGLKTQAAQTLAKLAVESGPRKQIG